MLVSLSCHIIDSLILYEWLLVVQVCCRCYQLGYQISAAAPYTALNHGPVQCNVEAAPIYDAHTSTYLPPSTMSFASCQAATYLLRSHYCWIKCTSAESTNLFSGPCYCIRYMYMYGLFKLTQLWSVPEKSGSMTSTTYNRICVILKCIITRVQCISLQELLPSCSMHILYDFLM